jgi:hypothetical protein
VIVIGLIVFAAIVLGIAGLLYWMADWGES